MKTFEIGKTYEQASACDSECIFRFMVVARTAKQVTLQYGDRLLRRGVKPYDGAEVCKPFGDYSMCVVLDAGRNGSRQLENL